MTTTKNINTDPHRPQDVDGQLYIGQKVWSMGPRGRKAERYTVTKVTKGRITLTDKLSRVVVATRRVRKHGNREAYFRCYRLEGFRSWGESGKIVGTGHTAPEPPTENVRLMGRALNHARQLSAALVDLANKGADLDTPNVLSGLNRLESLLAEKLEGLE